MDEAIKEDLIEALRSGEHVQGIGQLETGDGQQCCLGVLCEILDLPFEVIVDPGDPDSPYYRYYDSEENGCNAYLPDAARTAIGMTQAEQADLARLNDAGKTFEQIADYIEATL